MTAVPMTASAATRPALLPVEAEEALLLPAALLSFSVAVSQMSWQSDRVVKRFPLPEQPL